MQFQYFGHACFSISFQDKYLLFDPFVTGNELAAGVDVSAIQADYIFISHGHADHILDAESIAKRTGAKVICSWEIYEWLSKKGIEHIHPMNTGGQWSFDEFAVKCTAAQHSSGLPDGSYGGNPMGFLLFAEEKCIYYSGDTSLTKDMELIPHWGNVDTAILPIGDNFTMGYQDAALAAAMIKTNKIIGVHFDTFGYIKIDKEKAIHQFKERGLTLQLPNILEVIAL
jgi:Predicted Zn-dependent hydrolases of the beta-lactamase fold